MSIDSGTLETTPVDDQDLPLEGEVLPVPMPEIPLTSLALAGRPEESLKAAAEACKSLMKYIKNSNLTPVTMGKGNEHLRVEHWGVISAFFGYAVQTMEPAPVKIEEYHGYKCLAKLIRKTDGFVLGRATSLCMRDEHQWREKPNYALASMAATRAAAKCQSNVWRWVVVMQGFSGTPVEEMGSIHTTTVPAENQSVEMKEVPTEEKIKPRYTSTVPKKVPLKDATGSFIYSSEKQAKMFYGVARKSGWGHEQIMAFIAPSCGTNEWKEAKERIPAAKFDEWIGWAKAGPTG